MSDALHGVLHWVARQPVGLELELVCVEHPGPSRGEPGRTVVRLATCIREVPAHEVVELLTAGAATVVVRRDGCEHRGTATDHLAPVVRVLAAAGVPRLRIDDAGRPTTDDAAPARRGLAGLGRRPLRTRPRQVTREVLDAGRMPVPRRQVLGLSPGPARELPDALASGPHRTNAAVAALLPAGSRAAADLPSAAVRLAARACTACGVCVRACPTDALSVRSLGGADGSPMITSLLQDPTGCDGCLRCVQMCPADVLTVTGTWGWDEVLARVDEPEVAPVASLTTAECRRCHARFPTTDAASLCPVCTYRRANPFSSALPPGVVLAPGPVAPPAVVPSA